MIHVVVDNAMRNKLGNLSEGILFVDEAGRKLGQFWPMPSSGSREPRISEEEIQRRLRAGGGRSLAEIMADLEKQA